MAAPTNWTYSDPMSNGCEKCMLKQETETVSGSFVNEKEPPGYRRKRLAKQIFLIMVACVGYSSVGMAIGFPNVLATHIITDNSTIFDTEIHLNDWQMDMVASMMFVGSMPGFLFAGWLVGRIGRRWSILISGIPSIMGTALIALSYNVTMLLVGRFLDGIMFGMMAVALRAYVIELSDVSIRGSTSILVNLSMQIGTLLMLGMGISVTWYYVAMLSCSITLLYCLVIVPLLLPESPTYLAIKNRDAEARALLLRLRGPYADLDEELRQLKKMNTITDGEREGYRTLLKPVIFKRLLALFGLFAIANFSGVQVLKSNTVRILESSGLALGRIVSTILITCVLFCGNFVMMLLVDKLGRRRCLIVSLSVIAVAYYSLGSYNFVMEYVLRTPEVSISQLTARRSNTTVSYESNPSSNPSNNWTWIPMVCLMVAAFGQGTGAGPLPFVLAPEYFPTSIRSQGMSLCTMFGGLLSFTALQLFSPMLNFLGSGGIYIAYATTATIGIPYTIFLIHETSGKSVG